MKHPTSFSAKLFACLLMTILPACTMNIAGCQHPLTVDQVVGIADGYLEGALPFLDQAPAIAADLRLLDPALADQIEKWAPIIRTNAQNAIALGKGYLAAPSGDNYQKLLNAVDALGQTVNQQVLSAAKITNPASQQKVLALLGLVATGIHLSVALLKQHATSSQINNLPAIARVDFRKVRPYLNRGYAHDQLAAQGFDANAVLASVGM